MHSTLRLVLSTVMCGIYLEGSESKIPSLYEYQSSVEVSIPSSVVLQLDEFTVASKRYHLSLITEREFERFLNKREDLQFKKNRIEIVSDIELLPLSFRGDYTHSLYASPGSGMDFKLRDVFLIDMPGGGVLKAQFRSGLSIQINKNTRFILRPSRKKLVSIRVDW